MSITSTFNYFPSLPEALQRIQDFAKKNFPEVDVQNCSSEDRDRLFQRAVEAKALASKKEVPLMSLREYPLSIEQGGAALVSAPSCVDFQSPNFREPVEVITNHRTESHLKYYEEVEKIARDLLGPRVIHAWCIYHVLRQSNQADLLGAKSGPIAFVHNDFTEEYDEIVRTMYTTGMSKRACHCRKMINERHGLKFTKEEMAKYRLVVLNTWRPITEEPLRRDPLAVCDNRSINREDLFSRRTDIGRMNEDPDDDFTLEVYTSMYNPEQRWHYVPNFTNQELLVFKTFDSEMDPFIPTLHSAFELPGQESAPPRESCEARVICLLEKEEALVSKL